MSLLILSAQDVLSLTRTISHDELTALMEDVFIRVSAATANSPPRLSISTENHLDLFMPSQVSGYGIGIKVVSVPTSVKTSKQGIASTTLLMDQDIGELKAVINSRSLTALRTAAGSLLATKLICTNQLPTVLVAFGSGAQIDAHVSLHLQAYESIHKCFILVRNINERAIDLVSRVRAAHQAVAFELLSTIDTAADRKRDILLSADIICCATPSRTALMESSWLKPGAHLNLVGSYTPQMAEVTDEVIHRASVIAVDSREAALEEAGELISAQISGATLLEVGEICMQPPPRSFKTREGDITIFKSVGIGAQDVVIADLILKKALELGVGTSVAQYDTIMNRSSKVE